MTTTLPAAPILGSRAGEIQIAGSGVMGGPAAFVPAPTSVTSWTMQVLPASGSVTGAVSAAYYPDSKTVWYGVSSPITISGTTWTATPDGGQATFNWTHYDSQGHADGTAPAATLAAFAAEHGGDAAGARLEFELGCDGHSYFFDDLADTSSEGAVYYDFEGNLVTPIISEATGTCGTPFAGPSRTQTLKTKVSVSTTSDSKKFPVQVFERPLKTHAYQRVRGRYGVINLLGDTDRNYRLTLSRSTYVYLHYAGGVDSDPGDSTPALFKIPPGVQLSSKQGEVHPGDTAQIHGQYNPKKKFGFVSFLAFKPPHKDWQKAHTYKGNRTSKAGSLNLSLRVKKVGQYALSVVNFRRYGYTNGSSYWIIINVVPRPKPRPKPAATTHTTVPPPPAVSHRYARLEASQRGCRTLAADQRHERGASQLNGGGLTFASQAPTSRTARHA